MEFFSLKWKNNFMGLKLKLPPAPHKERVSDHVWNPPRSSPLPQSSYSNNGHLYFPGGSFFFSQAWMQRWRRTTAAWETHTESFFLFYVNRDWWNILHRVRAFDKKYWWLLSVSVTWDDRMLRFKMNYGRNSLFGNVIHFISSLVLWENDWSHEYRRWNHFLGTL